MVVTPRLEQVRMRPDERRAPGEPIAGVRRLVVVRNDRLGDFLLSLPAIEALRAAYPGAWIGVVVPPEAEPLARRIEGVDRAIPAGPRGRGLPEILRASGPDLVVCVSRRLAPAVAAVRARVRHRVGTGFRAYSLLFTRRVDERRRAGERHEVEYALSFAHRAGAPAGAVRFGLPADPRGEEEIAGWLASQGITGPFVVVHPGSGGSCPRWPLEHFLRLSHDLERAGVPVVISAGRHDEEVARAASGRGDAASSRPPLFRGPVESLAALTRRAALVISNSTAPVHLAAAQGRPTLAIHAPWPTCGVSRWGPYHSEGWGIVADLPGASGWSRRRRATCAPELMEGLRPEFVRRAAEALLAGRSPEGA